MAQKELQETVISLLKAQVQSILMQRKDKKYRRWFESIMTRKQKKGNKEMGTISASVKGQYQGTAEAYMDNIMSKEKIIYRCISREARAVRIVGVLCWGNTTGWLKSRGQKHLLFLSKRVNRELDLAELNNNDKGETSVLKQGWNRLECLSQILKPWV